MLKKMLSFAGIKDIHYKATLRNPKGVLSSVHKVMEMKID